MSPTVCVEQLHNCLEELKPLFVPHWLELGLDQEQVPLDPQYEVYLEREARGEVLCVTARQQGAIVGYFIGFIAPGLHYRTCLTLTMDIFRLDPQFREADSLSKLEADMLAMQIFERVELEARARGVQRAFYGSKVHRTAADFFEQLGLREVERYYSVYWSK